MIEDLINQLPEIIKYKDEKAFLEITKSHVYYSTKHDNKGTLVCVFVSIRESLVDMLEEAKVWIETGIAEGLVRIEE